MVRGRLSGDVCPIEARGVHVRQTHVFLYPAALGSLDSSSEHLQGLHFEDSVAPLSFAVTALTKHRKPGGLKPQNCILSLFWRPQS